MNTCDQITEQHWKMNREQASRNLTTIVGKIRTASLRGGITRYINEMQERADKPTEYIAEAVADSRHDILLLAGIDLSNAKGELPRPN